MIKSIESILQKKSNYLLQIHEPLSEEIIYILITLWSPMECCNFSTELKVMVKVLI